MVRPLASPEVEGSIPPEVQQNFEPAHIAHIRGAMLHPKFFQEWLSQNYCTSVRLKPPTSGLANGLTTNANHVSYVWLLLYKWIFFYLSLIWWNFGVKSQLARG